MTSSVSQGKERYLLKSQDFISTTVPYLMDIGNYCTNAGYGIHITEIVLYEKYLMI